MNIKTTQRGYFMTYKGSFLLIAFTVIAFSCSPQGPYQGYNQGYNNQGGYNPNNNNQGYNPQASQGSNAGQPGTPTDPRGDSTPEPDPKREEMFRRERDRCRDESDNHQCKRDCKLIYKRSADRKDCERLSEDTIEDILAVHEDLEDADPGDIDLEHFENYLKVSINGLIQLIASYRKPDAKNLLDWIASDPEVAEIFEGYDDDFRVLSYLLETLKDFDASNTKLYKPFIEDIHGSTLFEIGIDYGNEIALDWFLEFIFETKGGCDPGSGSNKNDCFKTICTIGKGFDRPKRRPNWLDESDSFEDYIEDIIENDVLGNSSPTGSSGNDKCWNTSSISTISDLDLTNDTWFEGLCKHSGGDCVF